MKNECALCGKRRQEHRDKEYSWGYGFHEWRELSENGVRGLDFYDRMNDRERRDRSCANYWAGPHPERPSEEDSIRPESLKLRWMTVQESHDLFDIEIYERHTMCNHAASKHAMADGDSTVRSYFCPQTITPYDVHDECGRPLLAHYADDGSTTCENAEDLSSFKATGEQDNPRCEIFHEAYISEDPEMTEETLEYAINAAGRADGVRRRARDQRRERIDALRSDIAAARDNETDRIRETSS